MKRVLPLLLILILLLTAVVSAEEDDGYTIVDSFTGEPVDVYIDGQQGNRVRIDGDLLYDFSENAFVETVGGVDVFCSVASGLYTTDTVYVRTDETNAVSIYKDGGLLNTGSQFTISEPGSYVVSATAEYNQTVEPFRFTIVPSCTGAMAAYYLPAGFEFTEVYYNGQPINFAPNGVDLTAEGSYQMNYSCPAANASFVLSIDVDHTAPVLALTDVEDGVADGPVDISDVEPGCSVYVSLDGEEIAYERTLTESGNYSVVVVDPAGNSNTYNFVIRLYFNQSGIIFLVGFVAFVGGVIGYLIYSRKKLRIR